MRQGRRHVADVDRGAAYGGAQGARHAGVRVPALADGLAVLHQEEGLGQRPLITSSSRISEKPLRGFFCCLRHCERSEAIYLSTEAEWIAFVAEPVIRRAFARPVGSLAQTLRVCRRQ